MNRAVVILAISLMFSCTFSTRAAALIPNHPDTALCFDTIRLTDSLGVVSISNIQILDTVRKDSTDHKKYKSKKLIAAILSFPVPFGLLGLHRVFLGTRPYIPFVYIGTLGGCFLILPILDFAAILSANEESFKNFEDNPRVFMWSH